MSAETVYRGAIEQSLSFSGEIRSRDQVSVTPKIGGRVAKLDADLGKQVKAGDVIAELDNREAQNAVHKCLGI